VDVDQLLVDAQSLARDDGTVANASLISHRATLPPRAHVRTKITTAAPMHLPAHDLESLFVQRDHFQAGGHVGKVHVERRIQLADVLRAQPSIEQDPDALRQVTADSS
jgi:hypothetical protein